MERNHEHRIYNGSTKLLTWLLALINILLASGVIGLIAMYGKVSAFEVRFASLEQKVDMVIQGQILVGPRRQ